MYQLAFLVSTFNHNYTGRAQEHLCTKLPAEQAVLSVKRTA